MDVEVVDVGIESRFAQVLQLAAQTGSIDPIVLIQQFRDIASTKALQVKDEFFNDENLLDEFESWQLETKLWHLVEILYSFRLSEVLPHKEYSFSSACVKEDNFRKKNQQFAELSLIIQWIQINAKQVDTEVPLQSKWNNTRKAIERNHLDVLNQPSNNQYPDELDPDAPIRTGKPLHPDDVKVDEDVFKTIYKLVLYRRFDEAVSIAKETGNYGLSIILVGDMLPYLDTTLDKEYIEERDVDAPVSRGLKHKLLWFQSVYALAQNAQNKYERLLYNYLSGANITENILEATDWDECLLLYCNQVLINDLLRFYEQFYKDDVNETLDIAIPKPQVLSIDAILNALLSFNDSSRHPIRIVMGAVMIKKVNPLVTDIVGSDHSNDVYSNTSLLRILEHLSIFIRLTQAEYLDPTDFTKLLILYAKKLTGVNKELIPIYLSFVPDETRAVEFYSEVLLSIRDKDEKLKQIQACKKLEYFNVPVAANEERLSLFIKKAVTKILEKTESHYNPNLYVTIKNDTASIDDTDREVSESVDWLVANNMYEDIIIVSLNIIKRFLLNGKLAALKEFSKEKNFKQYINSYDSQVSITTFSSEKLSPPPTIPEEEKDELLNFDAFIKGINSIAEWRKFVEDNGSDKSNFKTKDVEHSINKITTQLNELVMRWFVNCSDELLREFRNIYVPYLVIELLKIYEFSRFNNVLYLNKSFELIKLVANEDENDLLRCFLKSGRLNEFLSKCGEVALVASENGIKGIFV